MENEIEQVIDNIIRIRKNKKISIVKLSNDSGISRSHLFYIESGKTSPTLETLSRIAAAMNVKMIDFFKPAPSFNISSFNEFEMKAAENEPEDWYKTGDKS